MLVHKYVLDIHFQYVDNINETLGTNYAATEAGSFNVAAMISFLAGR